MHCQDVSSFGNAPVKMSRLSAMHLSRCVIFRQGALCVCVCVFSIISALNELSRCVVIRQCTCQDVSSLGRGPCVCVCVFSIISALNALSRCFVFRQCTCQNVSFLGRGLVCVCACLCVLPYYFCPKCIVNMCRLSAMHLSTCVSSFDSAPVKMCHLRAGGLVCVLFLCICALSALSRCLVFRQCTCQDVSSFGRGPCVCVCLFHYFWPKCIVKMCRLSAMHLSRCVVFGQGALCVCVCVSSPLFLP